MNTSEFKILDFDTRQLVDANVLLERLKRKVGLNTTQWHNKAQKIAGARSIGSRSTLAEVITGNSARKLPLNSIPYLIEALGLPSDESDYYISSFIRVFLPRGCQKYVSTTKEQEQIQILKEENIGLIRKLFDQESFRLLSDFGGAEKVVELEIKYGIKRESFELPVNSSYEMFNAADFGPFEDIAKHAEYVHEFKRKDWINFIIQVLSNDDLEFQQFVSCLLPKEFESIFRTLFVPVDDYYVAYSINHPIRAYLFASWVYQYSIEEEKLDALLSVYATHNRLCFEEVLRVNKMLYVPGQIDELKEDISVNRYEYNLTKYDKTSTPFELFLEKNLKKIRAISIGIYNQINPFGIETHIDFRFAGDQSIARFLQFQASKSETFSLKELAKNYRVKSTEFFPTLMDRENGLMELLQFMILRDARHINRNFTSIIEFEDRHNVKNKMAQRKHCGFIINDKQTLKGLLAGAKQYIEFLDDYEP
ncbi:hypothetical protein [Shewanella phaeophyticola]|uniref:Uncharacterized protein n=1 Tax=Shewanella phaeophyticola TaxID=2978345 RepID=A0ABT2P6L6_9GAMM|nr:hypothetical protein [Shewanella sp. KJ10-1]MCT8988308.1 hypothetical protein [Shewanella sp. KJ10-1]